MPPVPNLYVAAFGIFTFRGIHNHTMDHKQGPSVGMVGIYIYGKKNRRQDETKKKKTKQKEIRKGKEGGYEVLQHSKVLPELPLFCINYRKIRNK